MKVQSKYNFASAEEARAIEYKLRNYIQRLRWDSDLMKLVSNLSDMITRLSQLEVEIRRSGQRSSSAEEYRTLKESVQSSMKRIDNYILLFTMQG